MSKLDSLTAHQIEAIGLVLGVADTIRTGIRPMPEVPLDQAMGTLANKVEDLCAQFYRLNSTEWEEAKRRIRSGQA